MSTIKSSAENLTLNADGANNDVIIQSNASTKVTVDGATGNVGIGTTSPDKKLDVSGTGNVYAKVQSTNSTAAGINLKTNGGSVEDWLMQADEGANGVAWYNTAYRMTLGNTGDLNINTGDLFFGTAGKGIVLGATTNVDANTLDDYEEGTWTPVFSTSAGSSVAGYSGNSYNYTKIGNTCTIYGYFHSIAWASITDGTYLQLQGLPFASSGYSGVSTPYSQGNLGGFYVESSGSVALFLNKDTGSEFNQGDAVPTGNRMMLSLTYRTT